MSARIWSGQQDAVFDYFVNADGHLVVRARAGTGKTTTIVEAVKRYLLAHPGKKVIVCAFNKRIADELTARFVGFNVEVKTLHGIGFAAVRRYWPDVRVERKTPGQPDRKTDLTERVCGSRVPDAIKKLISKLHTLGREIAPHAQRAEELVGLAHAFDIEPDEEWQEEGFTVEFIAAKAVAAMELAAREKPVKTGIDFADMIFLPVRNRWTTKTHDLVVVDEAQDMTVAQLEIARGVCRGRLCVVGDNRQAIYGFRGADSESLDRLKQELQAAELGLTTTYRCGKAIVDLAQQIVPDFQAGPENPEGLVGLLNYEKLADRAELGDFVLSRMNAPLVATAMSLLRGGKRTKIAGRDIGAGLRALVRKLTKTARSVPEFLERLGGWQQRETARALAADNEAKIDQIADQAEMLRNLADGAPNVTEIENRIEALFTDDGLGQAGVITCSSVHRAKGLETDRVFILADTLKDHNIEEQNIRYVAITRAKHELVWVGDNIEPRA